MLSEFVPVARVGDLADGEMTLITPQGQEVVLARVGDEYFAIGAICSHAYGMLDQGTLYGYEVECPIHTGRFDVRTGRARRPPAIQPIMSYEVRIEGDQILVGPRQA
jgi:nitrite reductase/ring-hydroxylating ferredoxin subunit